MEMKKIEYEINFLDFWHISSGESGGALYDSLVKKDKNKMPYVPGKTIKGLVREYAEKYSKKEFIENVLNDAKAYFSNVEIIEYDEIVSNELQDYLYKRLSFTSINSKNSIAKDHSLREIEFVIPVKLKGYVRLVEEYKDELIFLMKSIKRLGLNRNRGFGRCNIVFKDTK